VTTTTRRTATRRAGRRRAAVTALTALALSPLTALASCGTGHHPAHAGAGAGTRSASANANAVASGDAADTVRSLGAVPIPRPPTAQATPTASEHHLQLVAMGEPVNAHLPAAQAVVRASGPTEDLPRTAPGAPLPTATAGTVTVTLDHATAALTVHAGDFDSRDEQGRTVALHPVGASTATATPGHRAALVLRGTFHSGAAELTWRPDHHVVAVWDFTVELD